LISEQPHALSAFRNNAAHYVYVRAGETIAVASSAQGIGNGHMQLTSPDRNTVIDTRGSSHGKIANRNEEILGPDAGYTPFKHTVLPGQEGVWEVLFIPPSSETGTPENRLADDEWTQPTYNHFISAWDVSVRNVDNTAWVKGRVFVHVLNLHLSSATLSKREGAFYGQNYVLTKDGYIYKVDGNGSHGILFNYFVNSSGMFNELGEPSYKSQNFYAIGTFHSPLEPDTDDERHITHKMFYTMPDTDMPRESVAALPNGSTWLYNKIEIAKIENVTFNRVEDNGTYLNTKGGYIEFTSDFARNSRYEVLIESVSDDIPVARRTIIHNGHFGTNRLHWDGLDNDKKFMPMGQYPIKISVAIMEGEIHFPYFDMEINPNGIRIDRINPDGTFHSHAEVFWDDRDIYDYGPEEEKSNPIFYLGGNSETVYRHSWGSYRNHDYSFENQYRNPNNPNQLNMPYHLRNSNYGAYSFGNEKAMDTWSYGVSPKADVLEEITVKVSDLEVVRITSPQDTIEPGDLVTYQVLVRNNGPSDAMNAAFEFKLPEGFRIESAVIKSTCGTEIQQNIQQNHLETRIDIPNGCEIIYNISARTGDVIPDNTYGYLNAEA